MPRHRLLPAVVTPSGAACAVSPSESALGLREPSSDGHPSEAARVEPTTATVSAGLVADVRPRLADRATWEGLYTQHYPALFRHLRHLVHDDELAREFAQETFVRAIARAEHYDGRSSLSTWLHGIALNLARNHWRRCQTSRRARDRWVAWWRREPLPSDRAPEQGVVRHSRIGALQFAIERLPIKLREAFVMRELEELSVTEACARLEISPTNLSVRVHRARRAITKTLSELGWLDETETR